MVACLELVAELIRLKVEIIITSVTNDSLVAKDATKEIPIVMAAPGDPVRTGLVENFCAAGWKCDRVVSDEPGVERQTIGLDQRACPQCRLGSGAFEFWRIRSPFLD